ncbi:hypothetical protein TB2_034351 [Malus domestica]
MRQLRVNGGRHMITSSCAGTLTWAVVDPNSQTKSNVFFPDDSYPPIGSFVSTVVSMWVISSPGIRRDTKTHETRYLTQKTTNRFQKCQMPMSEAKTSYLIDPYYLCCLHPVEKERFV